MSSNSGSGRVSLRAFVLSEGPKSAKVLRLDPLDSIANQFSTVCKTLRLQRLSLRDVSFHATVKKRIDVRPLAVDKPLSAIGLHDNDIFIVRRLRDATPSPPISPSPSPQRQEKEVTHSPTPAKVSPQDFAMPQSPPDGPCEPTSSSKPAHHATTPNHSQSSADHRRILQDRQQRAEALQDDAQQHMREPHTAETMRPAPTTQPVEEKGLPHGNHMQQRVTTSEDGAVRCRRQARGLVSDLHLSLAALCASQRRACELANLRVLSAAEERDTHEELLDRCLERCGCLASSGVDGRTLLAAADDNPARVYEAVERNFELTCEDGGPPPRAVVKALSRLLSHCAPGLVPAATLICVLYEGRVLDFLACLLTRGEGLRAPEAGSSSSSSGWFDAIALARIHTAMHAVLLGDADVYARVLESAVDAACQADALLTPREEEGPRCLGGLT